MMMACLTFKNYFQVPINNITAENKLTDLECQFFSKGKWLSLTDLDFCNPCDILGSNKIGDKGCLYLS